MVTTNIIFDRKKQAKKNGVGTIEIRVTCNRKSIYISTGLRVRASEWKVGQIVNRPDADAMNERLIIIYKKISGEVNRCIRDGGCISTDDLRQKVWQMVESNSGQPVLLEWIGQQIPLLNLGEGTAKHYRTLLSRMTEFGQLRTWADLTPESLTRFDAWLHQRKSADGRPISDAGVFKYHKCLKALLNRAYKFGRIDANPYDRLKGQFKRGERENVEYLTEDEMQRFEALQVPEGSVLEQARDLFVFQMYTGLSYSDAQAFRISDYKWDGQRWTNTGERIKTGVPYVSSILPPALRVLERYGMQVPKMDNADYNHLLKALGVMAGIQTRLHSHLARHTFATFMLRNGVKIENVSRMLGHTNITQTQRYAKVIAQSVHEEFDRIAKKLEK